MTKGERHGQPVGPPEAWDCHVHVFDAVWPRPAGHDGHYAVDTHTLEQAEAVAATVGVRRLVLVQPSIYGGDNTLLLQALKRHPGRHRGVLVPGAQTPAEALPALHGFGVRGLRFNLVSPLGVVDPSAAIALLTPLVPALQALNWHVQWYARADHLPALVGLQARCGLTFVLDHLGGLSVAAPPVTWSAAAQLARAGAWIKLSGWYRLGAPRAPFAELAGVLDRARELFGPRCVWGSDWPHTGLAPTDRPFYADLLRPLQAAAGGEAWQQLMCQAPQRLYG